MIKITQIEEGQRVSCNCNGMLRAATITKVSPTEYEVTYDDDGSKGWWGKWDKGVEVEQAPVKVEKTTVK